MYLKRQRRKESRKKAGSEGVKKFHNVVGIIFRNHIQCVKN